MIPGKGTHTIGPILLTWEWNEEHSTADNVTLHTAGVMNNDQAHELGIMLIGLTVSDERLPVDPALSAYHTAELLEQRIADKGEKVRYRKDEKVRLMDGPRELASGITYSDALLCIQVMYRNSLRVNRYSIVSETTGGEMPWTVGEWGEWDR